MLFSEVIVFLHVPALIICGLAFRAGLACTAPRVKRLLTRSAVIWLLILWTTYTFVGISMTTCGGDLLYGFANCRIIPVPIANQSFMVFFLCTASALIYGVLVVPICGFLEWRNRRRIASAANTP